MKRITVRISDELHERIVEAVQRERAQTGQSVSQNDWAIKALESSTEPKKKGIRSAS